MLPVYAVALLLLAGTTDIPADFRITRGFRREAQLIRLEKEID